MTSFSANVCDIVVGMVEEARCDCRKNSAVSGYVNDVVDKHLVAFNKQGMYSCTK